MAHHLANPLDQQQALSRLVAAACASPGQLPADETELQDVLRAQEALSVLGHPVTAEVACAVWEFYNADMAAGWISSGSVDGARNSILNLCTEIAAGQDYVGFTAH